MLFRSATLASDASSTTQQIDLLMRAAQLHHERLGKADDAARLLARVLQLSPQNARGDAPGIRASRRM